MKKILFLILNFGTIAAFAQNTDLVRSLNIADSLSRTKNYEKADAAFSDIIKTKPDWAVAYAKRAITRLNMNKLAESRADIEKAQELDGTNRLVVAAKKKYEDALEALNPPKPQSNAAVSPEMMSQNEQKPQEIVADNTSKPQETSNEQPKIDNKQERSNNNDRATNSEQQTNYTDPNTGTTTTKYERTSIDGNNRTHTTTTTTTRTERNTYAPNTNVATRPLSRADKIAQLSQAIRQNPNDSQAYAERGLQYGILGNDFAALQDYNMALQINPNNGNAYYLRGVHYVTKGGRRTRAKGCADLQRAAALGMSKANEVLARECR